MAYLRGKLIREMRNKIATVLFAAVALTSCNSYNQVVKTTDYDYKYEAAKEYFMAGQYTRSYQLLEELVMMLKGTDKAQESLYMLGLCYYNLRDYEAASVYLERYYKSYSKGDYAEDARFLCGKAAYLQSPDPRLDQSATYTAISKIQEFLELYPYSQSRDEANDMILQLQNRLVQKEYDAAKLYYNLGSYVGNCTNGGSNYEACIITAENALKAYPYTNLREDLYMMILRARYLLAEKSVDEKSEERYRSAIDEYYGFKNEFPESKYTKEADQIFRHANSKVKN